MNKQEVIKILEKKRETALDNFEYYRDKENEKYENMNRARVDSYTLAIQLLEQLDEPQAEKVEVPDFVAEWIEYAKKKGHTVIQSGNPWDLYGVEWTKANDWINQNQDTFARAFMDGYTVKPKRWVVKMATGYFMDFEEGCNEEGFEWVSSSKSCCLVFTDKSKAEAVATLVEGSVEEV